MTKDKQHTHNIPNIPQLVGVKEFSDIIGWNKSYFCTKLARQEQNLNVRLPLPPPIQKLASTPVWTLEQAYEYKQLLEEAKERKKCDERLK